MSSLKVIKKIEDLSAAQFFALVNKCGGLENALAVLRGEMRITLEEVIRLLFDRNGRCIPQSELTAAVCDPNTDYYFYRLADDVNPANFLLYWEHLFGQPSGLTAEEFVARIQSIKERVRTWPTADKSQVSNLFMGPHFPVILPQLPQGDYGTILQQTFLPAVEKAYVEAYPDRNFVNYRKGELVDQVTIVDERHAQLVADLQQGPIVGIVYYPLQGFSVYAQRETTALLMPDFISLCGAYESAVATALFPTYLARDLKTPAQDCSAVKWRGPGYSLYFSASDDSLVFFSGTCLGTALGSYSGGFFVRG